MPDSDDPLFRPEPTLLRPRPGAGKRGGVEPSRIRAAVPVSEAEPIPDAPRALLGAGLNPLVQAASPLLLLTGQLRSSVTPMDIPGLRKFALEEIRRFEEQARAAGVANEIIVAARYALCAGLDEAVLSTPWGAQSEWSQHPLLVALHREAWGGEKFFEMLDRIAGDPSRHIDLMELQYLGMAFGFAGKYQVMDRGQERLAEVQRDLSRKIRDHRGAGETALSLRWRGLEDRRNPLIRFVPWWVIGAAALALLAVSFTIYYARLADAAAPVHAELATIGLEGFASPPPAPAPVGPTVKQLLAADERDGTVSVEENGARTTVTLLARDLFASGSAIVNPAQLVTLSHVAAALNRVPGRVLVVGHTDDQPVRSLRYPDNFELSRDRAVSVVKVLQPALDNQARLSWNGAGASQPRYTPESDPENRARNRRVEIVHVRGL